jgi:phosphoribosylpyrophosphate synthetase
MQVADHYKEVLGTEHVTLLAPTIATPRQDKNTNSKTGDYEPVSINIHTTIKALSGSIDSFIVMEPHSFAAQTTAAELGRAFLPATPWRFLTNEASKRSIDINGRKFVFNKENTLIARPDKGRNIAATRIANYYGFNYISFDKTRINPSESDLSLPAEDQKKVKGMMCVVYDDELETCGTVEKMAKRLDEYQALGLIIVAVNGKFTGNWEKNIANSVIKKIFVSDSTKEIGNIRRFIDSGKIEVISLEKNISEILTADLNGINFWLDTKYNHMVLQTNGQDESC